MYMKKNFFYAAALAMGLTFSMTACSNEDTPTEPTDAANIDYTSENATSRKPAIGFPAPRVSIHIPFFSSHPPSF
jgi:hypothetical protein